MKYQTYLYKGSSQIVLPALPENFFDSCVCDPPYEINFMGKSWDAKGVAFNPSFWKEVYRTLKPGAYLAAFGGTRTFHRLACALEDAGFELRDTLCWLYGSGFPKSMDIPKQLDKAGEPVLAKQWEGFGTCLKPGWEPIVLARKPLDGTVVNNVTGWGCGGLNIDACRIALNGDYKSVTNGRPSLTGLPDGYVSEGANQPSSVGRFPANVILDEEAGQMLDQQSGLLTSGKPCGLKNATNNIFGQYGTGIPVTGFGDTGGASRFFYCPKASKKDRGSGNTHPTVKPHTLMRWLCRLITPPGGCLIDPFCGSGSTLLAGSCEGFTCAGIDEQDAYLEITAARLLEHGISFKHKTI